MMKSSVDQRKIIVVLGMHRSGTSAMTRGLQALGVGLGGNRMPAFPGNNEKGFFEDIDVNQFNTELLAELGMAWDSLQLVPPQELASSRLSDFRLRAIRLLRDKLDADSVFGLKDPRLARLMAFWSPLFAHVGVDAAYVLALRNPLSVSGSLEKRDGFEAEKSHYLWLSHMVNSVIGSAGAPRLVVNYDLLMADPSVQLSRISTALNLPLDADAAREFGSEFLEDSLRHTRFAANDLLLDPAVPPEVVQAYELLELAATDAVSIDGPEVKSVVEELSRRLDQMAPALRYMARSDRIVAARDHELRDREARLDASTQALSQRIDEVEQLSERLEAMRREVEARDSRLAESLRALTDCERRHETSANKVAELEQVSSRLEMELAAKGLQHQTTDRLLHNAKSDLHDVSVRLTEREQHVVEIDAQLASMYNENVQLAEHAHRLEQSVHALKSSLSWKLTAPLRALGQPFPRLNRSLAVARKALELGGGLSSTTALTARVLRAEGLKGALWRLENARKLMLAPMPDTQGEPGAVASNNYDEWVRRYDTLDAKGRQRIRDRITGFARLPKIAVVMPVFDPPLDLLEQAIQSVRTQLYPNWELCIADDASRNESVCQLLRRHATEDERIKLVCREQNGHISAASNTALEIATGEFVALLDHDDLLPQHALFWIADAINAHPDAALIYSDEDKITAEGHRYDPYFKCDLNYELLLAQNMLSHLGVYRRAEIEAVGGFRLGFEGSQDYDLALRVLERIRSDQVVHVPRVLYHWRAIAGSTALAAGEKNYAAEAGRRSVSEHLQRTGRKAQVMPAPDAAAFNRVRHSLPEALPLVSIIIPTRDRAELLGMCIDSVLEKTTYPNFELIVVDNGSVETRTRQLFSRLPVDKVRVVRDESPFNFSALNNLGAREAQGDVLCLMNNDIEILTADWLEEMVSFAVQADIGCVGARMWYPNVRLQHGGVLLGVGGVANHAHLGLGRGAPGYFGRAVVHQSFSALTAACLVIRRSVFEQVNGLDERLAVAFNDIDFCLRVRAAGYRNVWTPYAEMNHHESASRGQDATLEKQRRFADEVSLMKNRWERELYCDPAYNPNLTLDHSDFSLAWPPRVALI